MAKPSAWSESPKSPGGLVSIPTAQINLVEYSESPTAAPSDSPSAFPSKVPITVCTDPALLSSDPKDHVQFMEVGIDEQSDSEVKFKFSLSKACDGVSRMNLD